MKFTAPAVVAVMIILMITIIIFRYETGSALFELFSLVAIANNYFGQS